MRDRWVAVYLLLVALQLPLYYLHGRAPLTFEFAVKEAERRLQSERFSEPGGAEAVEAALERAEAALEELGGSSSRRARLELASSILAWRRGDTEGAVQTMERAREIFEQTHGADSFHAAAVDLRVGELLFLRNRFPEALVRFQRSTPRVKSYLGPRNSFYLRMLFLEVSTLVSLGQTEQAAHLANSGMESLRGERGRFDRHFRLSTGRSLDTLHRQGLIPPPADGMSWRDYLGSVDESAVEGRSGEDDI